MEMLDLTFIGVPVWGWLGIMSVTYLVYVAWRDCNEDRDETKEIIEAQKRFREAQVWRSLGGSDRGEWVRKDGQPIRD